MQVLPIANQIDDRDFFVAQNGVLNTGCALVTVIYACVGFYGYVKFGDNVADTITLNLPQTPRVECSICQSKNATMQDLHRGTRCLLPIGVGDIRYSILRANGESMLASN